MQSNIKVLLFFTHEIRQIKFGSRISILVFQISNIECIFWDIHSVVYWTTVYIYCLYVINLNDRYTHN